MIELMDHQEKASRKLASGKVLYSGVGKGKSATVMDYYVREESPRHMFVITTARKRDSLDWESVAVQFGVGVGVEDEDRIHGILTVDSWNNLHKYVDVEDAFFVFDEQRLVGYGSWVKSFLKIAKKNRWIMLSATPGDTWIDYAPIFIANGFYKNKTDFLRQHVLYEPFLRFPKIRGYIGERKLEMLRNDVLVEMPYEKGTTRYVNWLDVGFDEALYKKVYKDRWHVYEDRPIKDVAELWRVMRRVVNSSESRLEKLIELTTFNPRLIVFYNFDYELEILRTVNAGLNVYEYNGHVKDPIPEGESWVYLVQYVAGAEAWNCTETNCMAFYSLTYSYKNFEQAQGRIDRLNAPEKSLYYYVLMSNTVIDRAIKKSLGEKRNFNERRFLTEFDKFGVISEKYLESAQI